MMKITKVQYGKTYSLGNYCSERIDLEASIDETTETVADSIFQLRHYCDEIHKKNNPQLYQEQTPGLIPEINNGKTYQYDPSKDLKPSDFTEYNQPKLSAAEEEENLITSIESAQNEKELIQYKLLAAKNIKTMGIYKKRAKQLNLE